MCEVGFNCFGLEPLDPAEPGDPFEYGGLGQWEDKAISVHKLRVQGNKVCERLLSCPISQSGQGRETMP